MHNNVVYADEVSKVIFKGEEVYHDNLIEKDFELTMQGDLNNDVIISLQDLAIIAELYGIKCEDVEYKSQYDLKSDGIIDIYDLVYLSREISSLNLEHIWPFDGQYDYYPKYGYLELEFSEDMQPLIDLSKISLKSSTGDENLIDLVELGVNYEQCVLLIVNDNLKLNTEYTLFIPKGTLESQRGEKYNEDINIHFKTAHTVLKGRVYANKRIKDSKIWLIDEDGNSIISYVLLDGAYIFNNINAGNYKVRVEDDEGVIIEKQVTVKSGVVNELDI